MKINGNPDGGGGREPIVESLSVTQNGIYTPEPGVDGFDNVDVNVNPSLQSKSVTSNGLVTPDEGYYGLNSVDVNVPAPEFVTETLSVSANGTFNPGTGVDGFSQVVVDVPQSVTGYTEKEVTEGTYGIVNLNNSASFVKDYAFIGNTIQTVSLPECQMIGVYAFSNCTQLQSVNLPVCSNLGNYVFQNCVSLSQVNIPNCISIGSNAFQYDNKLQSVNFPVCRSIGNIAFQNCTSLSQVNIPVCSIIGNSAFQNCVSLSQINISNCGYIGNGAFQSCILLTQIDINASVGNNTFLGCINLSKVNLDNCSVTGTGIFNNCSSLEELSLNLNFYTVLPYTNNMLANTKIINGTGSIYVPAEQYSKYIISSGWSSLSARFVSVEYSGPILSYSDGFVYGRTNAIDSTFSTYLGIQKSNVTKVELPDCKYIRKMAFTEFNSLTEISIGSNCQYLEASACFQCWNLTKFTITTSYVCPADFNIFQNTKIKQSATEGFIYVPASLVDAYKSDRYWGVYESKIFPIE